MADSREARDMQQTPTWAVAVVCFVLLVISILIEHAIHILGKWLKKKDKPALYEALEKVKAELMLMGFISLLLTFIQGYVSDICIPTTIADTWHPCDEKTEDKKNDEKSNKEVKYSKYFDTCEQGKVAFASTKAIHQLHVFILVLAVCHVLYCIITYALGRTKMRQWKAWENETKTTEYQYYNDPERFRFMRDTSFGRRHLRFWSRSTLSVWIAHLAPENESKFDFRKYIKRSLDDDFKEVVGISPTIWFIALLFLLSYTNGWYSYFWLPFIPLVIILLVGTKLQVIITKMGLGIQDKGDVVRGTPLVQPGDDLFWFGSPHFLLFLIQVILFTNAFQLAFFLWSTYEFSLRSCYHQRTEDIIIRVSMGVIIQVLCSYVTLPLYALVNQMGTNMRPVIFSKRVAAALKDWHHQAKKHTKHGRHSESTTPFSSRPGTPTHGMSPVHLLHRYPRSVENYVTSPRHSDLENDQRDPDSFHSPRHHEINDPLYHRSQLEMRELDRTVESSSSEMPTQHQIDITPSKFSFAKR
ncbi:hypothetical protein DITRI_Ditri12bG0087400 [Diplodiscus trichospermus]